MSSIFCFHVKSIPMGIGSWLEVCPPTGQTNAHMKTKNNIGMAMSDFLNFLWKHINTQLLSLLSILFIYANEKCIFEKKNQLYRVSPMTYFRKLLVMRVEIRNNPIQISCCSYGITTFIKNKKSKTKFVD